MSLTDNVAKPVTSTHNVLTNTSHKNQ